MLTFRFVCAILMAWAVNWALSRPEADQLLQNIPDVEVLGPIAGATIGYFNLAVRQGWGFIVAFANGIWAGFLSVLLSGVFVIVLTLIESIRTSAVGDFEKFMIVFGEIVQPLLDEVVNVPLLVVSLGATAIVGVVTEVVHWLLVRLRAKKSQQRTGSTPTTRSSDGHI